MSIVNKMKRKGISLRLIHGLMIVLAVLISALLIYGTLRLSWTFDAFTDATEEYVELHNDAKELIDASDRLSESVQRFTLDANTQHLSEYFTEAFTDKNREKALSKMEQHPDSTKALKWLKKAMAGSNKLMATEYYAMKLVIVAKNMTDIDESGFPALQDVQLSAADLALPPEMMIERARMMVHDDAYYSQKDAIRTNMTECLAAVDELIADSKEAAELRVRNGMNIFRTIIITQAIFILAMIVLATRLGINPVLKAVDNIRDENPIPVIGANEFRYLANTYNRMYEVYKNSIDKLNYKASHDELTGAYNRAGYDLLLSSIDLNSTFLLLVDLDYFKSINDTYGHETGDEALKRVVGVLRRFFRADDCVCRIGGDEFAVLMVHATRQQDTLIGAKINEINEELSRGEGSVPGFTISVGIAHGENITDPSDLYEKADRALYAAKRAGRNCFHFYEEKKA